jgi:hypothetical protein
MTNDSGEEVSTREIKKILQDCIDNEDKRKPLNDDALADVLKEKGYLIARRTVAKYREQLNIPVVRHNNNKTVEDRYRTQEDKFIKSTIQQALEEIATATDPFIIERKENLIRKLEGSLREEEREIFSIDELILKAKELRKKRMTNDYSNYYSNSTYYRNSELDFSDKYSTMRSSFLN